MTITFAEARNVCAPDSKWAYPVFYECSLVCTPLAWSFEIGSFNFSMYKYSPNCPSTGLQLSRYFSNYPVVGVTLGCTQDRTEGVWQGQNSYALISTPPLASPELGLTLRFTCTMVVDSVEPILHITLKVERLVPASDVVPYTGFGQYVDCCTYTFDMKKDATSKTLDRNQPQTFITSGPIVGSPTLQPLPECYSETCPLDFQYIDAQLILYPRKFGCNGRAERYGDVDCSLNAGWRTFGCFAAYIEPLIPDTFYPKWVQLGVNIAPQPIAGCTYGAGCLNGSIQYDPFGILPPIYSITPNPAGDCVYLLTLGCEHEDEGTGNFYNSVNKQQIQTGVTQSDVNGLDFTQYQYQIAIKSINKRSPCVCIRETTTENIWYVAQPSTVNYSSYFYNSSGHYVAKLSFGDCLGQPVVTLYGLAFPAVIAATNCVVGVNPPNIFDPDYYKKKGILVDPDSLNVLGYNNLDSSNLIVTEPEIFTQDREEPLPDNIPYTDVYVPNTSTVVKMESKTPEQVQMLHQADVMKKYKNPCKYRSIQPIRKDSTCGCAGGGSNIYSCEVFGECKVITTKMDETLKTCVTCDRYELPMI
jgi:hypothetical protein